tara:strand:- start:79 stop:1323 length:1245 start_codon:yes stop_codon:yes gene_type:complete
MFEKVKNSISIHYFEYSACLLTASFFLGHAVLSVSYIIFLLASFKSVLKNFTFKEFLSNKTLIFPCIFFIFNLLILIILGDSIKDVLKAEKILCLLIFPIIFFSTKGYFQKSKSLFFNIRKTFVLTAFFTFSISFAYGLYRVFYAENALNSIYITYNHLADLFGVQPLYLSVFYLTAVIFSIDISRSKLRQRNGYFIISGVLVCGIVLLSSRTGLLLSFVVLLMKVFKIKSKTKNKTVSPVFLLLLISCLILTLSIPTLKNRVLKLNENISSYSGLSFRTKIWKNSIFVFQESSLFGHGLYLSQDKLMNQYIKTNFRRGYIYNLNTHNQYLQTLLDTGLIGLTLLIFMLVFPIRDIRNTPISELLFTVIILVSLIPESFFLRQYGVLFYSFFSCIFQVSRKELAPKNRTLLVKK